MTETVISRTAPPGEVRAVQSEEIFDLRVLYGGWTAFGMTSEHRLRAFRRCAREVHEFSYEAHLETRIPLLRRFSDRFQLSPQVTALNAALLAEAERLRPELIWLDKPIYVFPKTIRSLREAGFRVAAYNLDDPLGPRNDPVWRHFIPAIPEFSAHVVPRAVQVQEYLDLGVPQVVKVPLTFEPSVHFSPDRLALVPNRDIDVSFIGFPHDDRFRWINAILKRLPHLRFGLYGWGWERYAARLDAAGVLSHGPVWNDQYREVLWRSRMSIAFVTRSNRDEMSHKAVEIAASGTAMLLETSPEHRRIFPEASAIFFSDPDELPGLIERSLTSLDLNAIGRAGESAVHRAGLSNDDAIRHALKELGYSSAGEA